MVVRQRMREGPRQGIKTSTDRVAMNTTIPSGDVVVPVLRSHCCSGANPLQGIVFAFATMDKHRGGLIITI
jgi:hypothetical protein